MIQVGKNITILCSGMTLGVYTPAIIVERQLQAKGFRTDIEVFENLFSEDKRNGIKELKLACHRSFGVAKMAQKMARDNNSRNFDAVIVNQLMADWLIEGKLVFIVFSGYWMPIIEKYLSLQTKHVVKIYIFHMDAVLSNSWKPYNLSALNYKHIWLFEWEGGKIPCYLQVGNGGHKKFKDRENRILIHGGGWGIGTYKNHIHMLSTLGFKLDIIAYECADVSDDDTHDYFMIDTDWSPWDRTNGTHVFPPLKKVKGNTDSFYLNNNGEYSNVYNIIENSKAIISKPGGGTLVDSFSSATPLIMLEPYGEYEGKNASLWSDLGMGIYYEDWVNSNYSLDLLEQLHSRIVALKNQKKNVLDVYFNS